jgi:hypothetical protein
MASTGSIVFAITARDLASKSIGAVNKQLGKMGTAGKIAKIGLSVAAAAASAFAKIVYDSVKAAAAEELETVRLNAALKARGFALDSLSPKIQAQIEAFRKFGIVDSDVRKGIEIGSRFFKKQETLLKVNAVAAQIAAATGDDFATIVMAIGKASDGSTRGLAKYLGKIETGSSLTDILRKATEKYSGIAEEVANTSAAKFAAVQEEINDSMEDLGKKFLPKVNDLLTNFNKNILPSVEDALGRVGDTMSSLIDEHIAPFLESIDSLVKALGGENGLSVLMSGLDLVFKPLEATLDALKILIDAIVTGIKTIQGYQAAGLMPDGSFNPYLSQANTMGIGPAPVSLKVNFSIGTQKQDELVANALGRMGTGPSRNK